MKKGFHDLYSFFLLSLIKLSFRKPWNQFSWRKGLKIGKAIYLFKLSIALLTIRENQRERKFVCKDFVFLYISLGRTHNRIRTPRLKASGRQNNVGKGIRLNRPVTSG